MATGMKKGTASRLPKSAINGMATADHKPDRQEKKRAAAGRKKPRREKVARSLRTDFGLSMPIFSRMVGVPAKDLTRWEAQGDALGAAPVARIERVAQMLTRLAGIMRKSFISTWLEQPNKACNEINVSAPLKLFENGDFATLEGMIWHVESGTPG
jgi:DNA-binding transcriptional regulator YiaG